MTHETASYSGREVSDAQVQIWADESEDGYDVDERQRRWGRPPRAESASRVIPTRFSDAELAELMNRDEREGLDRSSAIRLAVRECVIVSPSARKHGIRDEDAVAAARSFLAGGPLGDDDPQRQLRLGLDTSGRLLGIVVLLFRFNQS